jgi:hypothetical protein
MKNFFKIYFDVFDSMANTYYKSKFEIKFDKLLKEDDNFLREYKKEILNSPEELNKIKKYWVNDRIPKGDSSILGLLVFIIILFSIISALFG